MSGFFNYLYSFVKAEDEKPKITPQAVFAACDSGNLDQLKKIIEAGGSPINTESDALKYEPLQQAADKGHLEVVKYLLSLPEYKGIESAQLEDIRIHAVELNNANAKDVSIYLKSEVAQKEKQEQDSNNKPSLG